MVSKPNVSRQYLLGKSLIDGTYFTWDLCLALCQDNTIKFTPLYRFSDGERLEEHCNGF